MRSLALLLLALALSASAEHVYWEGVWATTEDCRTLVGDECCCGMAGTNLAIIQTGEATYVLETLLVNAELCVPGAPLSFFLARPPTSLEPPPPCSLSPLAHS